MKEFLDNLNYLNGLFTFIGIILTVLSLFIIPFFTSYFIENRRRSIDSDIETYKKFIDIFPEHNIKSFIGEHDFRNDFSEDEVNYLKDFIHEKEINALFKFNNGKLYYFFEDFYQCAINLQDKINLYTSPSKNISDMYTVGIKECYNNPEKLEERNKEAVELNKLSSILYSSYKELSFNVKDILKI